MAGRAPVGQQITELKRNLDALRQRASVGREPEHRRVRDTARHVDAEVATLLGEIARRPADFETNALLHAIDDLQRDLDRATTEVLDKPQAVTAFLTKVRTWASLLPGDPTTPPPRY